MWILTLKQAKSYGSMRPGGCCSAAVAVNFREIALIYKPPETGRQIGPHNAGDPQFKYPYNGCHLSPLALQQLPVSVHLYDKEDEGNRERKSV